MICNNSASRHQTRPRQCAAKLELKLIQRLELAANIYSESSDYLHRDGGNEICFVSTTSIWHLVRPGCPHCSDLCLSPSPTRSGAAALKQGVKRKIRVVTAALRSQETLNHISLASEDNILISTYSNLRPFSMFSSP